jgi:hypothetical protein
MVDYPHLIQGLLISYPYIIEEYPCLGGGRNKFGERRRKLRKDGFVSTQLKGVLELFFKMS